MPVDFLTDEQAEAYARFTGDPSQTELERFFFLDDADRSAVEKRRGDANRGSGSSSARVRQLGAFLADPVDVPSQVVDYVAGQLGTGDPSCLKTYAGREKTRLEHQWEIARLHGYRDFASAEAELSTWIGDRSHLPGRLWRQGRHDEPAAVGNPLRSPHARPF